MPYSEKLASRVREALADIPDVEEKEMFRGVTFMVNGKMSISVSGMERLMCRIDPAVYDTVIELNGCEEIVMKGKVMKGYVYVYEVALKTKKDLQYWVNLCLDFNSIAKSSRKKKK